MNIEAMFTNDIIGGVTTYKNATEISSAFSPKAFRQTKRSGSEPEEASAARTIRRRGSSRVI